MGRFVALSTIRSEVAERYGLPAFASTGWTTLTAVNRSINESLQRFYALLMECFGDNYRLTSSSLTTGAGVSTTSLPADLFKLHSLMWVRDSGSTVQIRRGSVDDLRRATMTARGWSAPRYVLTGSSVSWAPVPDQAYTVECWYQSIPADLVSDSDVFDAGPGWLEWVVLDVCRKLAAKEQKDPSVWLAELGAAEQLVRSQAQDRAETDAPTMRDTRCLGRMGDHDIRDLLTFGDD